MKVIVIGGGAAGMIAAGFAAKNGNEVHIYEKNNKLGKKIYITGKGRCNITNAGDIDNFIENIPGNPHFLYSSFYNFDSEKTINFFNELGLETKIERGNRVFPVSDKSADVVMTLEKFIKKNKVKIHMESPVDRIVIKDKSIKGIKLKNGSIDECNSVILSTGGLSYPLTGSTGDGYKMAKEVGHTVTKLYPSLVPLKVSEEWINELMGLSLKNISIMIKDNNKILYKDFGEMMFTHYGVSGPVILSASRHLLDKLEQNCKLIIDLKPALDSKTLDLRILRDFEKYKNKSFKNSLDDLLPQKIIPVIINLLNIDPQKKVNAVTKDERKRLVEIIKEFKLTINGTSGFNEAVITSGGINVDEINPSTMESKIIKGLYFAGEIIDVDAYTGGYNLQIAFSTGYTAGINV